jgi:hypothetical protein
MQGKLICMLAVAVAMFGFLAMSAQADGHQPCHHLRLRSDGVTEEKCEQCCAEANLQKGVSYDKCRCIRRAPVEHPKVASPEAVPAPDSPKPAEVGCEDCGCKDCKEGRPHPK